MYLTVGEWWCVAIAVLIIIIFSCNAMYLRRLNRIAREEVRERHSIIPEPKNLMAAVYKLIVLGLFITIFVMELKDNTELKDQVHDLQIDIFHLKESQKSMTNTLDSMTNMLYSIDENVAGIVGPVSDAFFDTDKIDYENETADIDFYVVLKDFSEETEVSIDLNGLTVPLKGNKTGIYSGKTTLDLFDYIDRSSITVKKGRKETTTDFKLYGYVCENVLDFPEVSFEHEDTINENGRLCIHPSDLKNIESATLTYFADDLEKTIDVTEQAVNEVFFDVDPDLHVDMILQIRLDLKTETGYTFSIKKTLTQQYGSSSEDEMAFTGPSGNSTHWIPYELI